MQVVGTSLVNIQLIGCFQLSSDALAVHLPLQAQRVVAYLAVNEKAVARQQLSERLWPYTSQGRAHANLRTALWRIRQEAPTAIASDRDTVRLDPSVLVDYRQILLANGKPHPSLAGVSGRDLVSRLRNDLLPGWDEDWLMIERERARQLRMRCLENLSCRYLSEGNVSAAIDAAYASIEIEPLRESAHLALIEAHLAEGNRTEAVRQACRMAKLVQDELGISPSGQFTDKLAGLGLAPSTWAS